MGSTFSEQARGGEYPSSGKPIFVKVQCSHNGKSVSFGEHRGHRVTCDWTFAQLQEAVEVLAGVHRHCQRMMFGGRLMEPQASVISMLGCSEGDVPERIKLFLIVDRFKFPQTFGPFNLVSVPLEAKHFDMPAMNPEMKRCGFYWDLKPKVLESHGLNVRAKQLTAQVSPIHPVDAPQKQQDLPKGSSDFVWSYPAAGWEGVESDCYSLDGWVEGLQGGAAVKSFLSVGGFMYFDDSGRVSGVSTLGRPQDDDPGDLHFAEPRRWLPEWTAALAEMGRFQRITIKSLRDTGVRMYLWLRPHEVIEGPDGNPLPVQPDAPHGAFVYLFHENILSTDEVDNALDRYFAVDPTPSATTGLEEKTGVFRALTLIGPQAEGGTFCEYEDDSDDEDGDMSSFLMSTPATTPMDWFTGTPSTWSSPKAPKWPSILGASSPPELPARAQRQPPSSDRWGG